jgi:ubiquinone/menaquinone biosynthesis C-methylase UbiE
VPPTSSSLADWIDSQPALLGDQWLQGLESRKQEEAEFHDQFRSLQRAEELDSTANTRFYAAFAPVRELVNEWIGRTVPGGSFLDYACGRGDMAIAAARAGAALSVGIDISPVSVRSAAKNSDKAGVSSETRFLQRDCEATGLPDDSFDACLCSGMLHHLDLARALPELHRITAPAGRILCVEALGYNPVIQWYRNRTSELRTAWEKDHILTLREVRFAERWFRVENLRFHLMAGPLGVLAPGPIRAAAIRLGQGIDRLLTNMPLIQRWSWVFTFELVKLPK